MRYAVFLVLFFIMHTTRAQESLAKDISYDYLDKLITVCKKNYPKIKTYEDRVGIAEHGIKKAKLSYFDIFSVGYLYSPNNNNTTSSPSFLGGYQFGFFANVGMLLQKPSFIKQAKGEYAAALHDKEANDLSMEAEVKKRYFTYIQRVAVLRLRSATILDVESMLTNIKHRFEKGEESLDNYNKALIVQSDHAQNVINAEGDVLNAKTSLEELLGQKLENIK